MASLKIRNTLLSIQRQLAVVTMVALLLAVLAVLLPPSHGSDGQGFHPARCVASLVRRLPCQEATPFATLQLHLDAYRVLGNAALVATSLLLGLPLLWYAWLATVATQSPGPARSLLLRLHPSIAISPWRISYRLRRWVSLRERSDAAMP